MADFEMPEAPEGGWTAEQFDDLRRQFIEHEATVHPYEAIRLFVRGLWPIIRRHTPQSLQQPHSHSCEAVHRLLEAGADPQDVAAVLRYGACEGVWATLVRLDDVGDMDTLDLGWQLMETAGEDRQVTGRQLAGLHDCLFGEDPTGQEGADLWQ